MVKIPDNIIQNIKDFVKEAEYHNVTIQKAVLFGSYAKGTNHEWSDIDIAVVSNDFEGIRINDNQLLFEPIINTNVDIEPHPYRPEDFNEDDPFVKEILSYGVRIV